MSVTIGTIEFPALIAQKLFLMINPSRVASVEETVNSIASITKLTMTIYGLILLH